MKANKLKQLMKHIATWAKSNKMDVTFVGSFIEFDNEGYKDGALIAYGNKDIIDSQLKDLTNELKKDKDEFINW